MRKYNMMIPKKYQDNNGNTKTQWVRIGSMIENGVDENGKPKMFGSIDATPTFEWDGSFNLFEQEERAQPQQGQHQGQQYNQQQTYNAPHGQVPVYR